MLTAAPRPSIHAAYDCNLVDRKNATSWLDFGWEYLDEGYGDSPRSLKLKYELVKAQALKGVLIWCTQTQAPELWRGLDEAFGPARGRGAVK